MLANNYEEIKGYLPDYYDDIVETQAYLKALGHQLDLAESSSERVLDNNFIYRADEETIKRLERYLFIPINRKKTLDDRKRLVASFFVGFGKLSATKIKDIVYQFTNAVPEVDFKDSKIYVEIERGDTENLYIEDVYTVLSKRIPAHLGLLLGVKQFVPLRVSVKTKYTKYKIVYCGTLNCGLHPSDNILGINSSIEIKPLTDSAPWKIEYKLSGTLPQDNIKAELRVNEINIQNNFEQYKFNYALPGIEKSGVNPNINISGDIEASGIVPEIRAGGYKINYMLCGTKKACNN